MRACLPVFLAVIALAAPSSIAQPSDGYDWATIGAVGNIGYDREDPSGDIAGRGSLGYEYRIGRTEVTTGQWIEFYNAYYARATPLNIPWVDTPVIWGAEVDPDYQGPGFRFRPSSTIPNAAMVPAGGVTWRTSAILCNWLSNDKGLSQAAFENGAYDISTFGQTGSIFTDQAVHNPGARYWIPTLDEWLKAGFFDPNKNGPGQGGWWINPDSSDASLLGGAPGIGDVNARFELPNDGQYRIPLGAYTHVQSPWGLFDVGGATREWTESIHERPGVRERFVNGSEWGRFGAGDWIYLVGSRTPFAVSIDYGVRIASVPAPPAVCAVLLGIPCMMRRRR